MTVGGIVVVLLRYLLPSLLFLFQSTASESNLFDHLINIWEFSPGPNPGTCNLYFFVDFKFNSPLYRQVNVTLVNLFYCATFFIQLMHVMLNFHFIWGGHGLGKLPNWLTYSMWCIVTYIPELILHVWLFMGYYFTPLRCQSVASQTFPSHTVGPTLINANLRSTDIGKDNSE